jgi:hypothetical protein
VPSTKTTTAPTTDTPRPEKRALFRTAVIGIKPRPIKTARRMCPDSERIKPMNAPTATPRTNKTADPSPRLKPKVSNS